MFPMPFLVGSMEKEAKMSLPRLEESLSVAATTALHTADFDSVTVDGNAAGLAQRKRMR